MRKYHTIGWQGITVNVPENWRLAYARGTFKEGSLRVDDEQHPRLEVRWTKAKKNAGLTSAMKRFLAVLKRRARKEGKKLQLSESPQPFTTGSAVRNRELQCFSWSTDVNAWGAIWRCRDCNRIVAAHVIFHGRNKNFTLVKQVLSSVKDHPSPKGILWSARGLRFRLPHEFKLRRRRFRTDSSKMEFRVKPRNRLIVAWKGPAKREPDAALRQPRLNAFCRTTGSPLWRLKPSEGRVPAYHARANDSTVSHSSVHNETGGLSLWPTIGGERW